MWTPPLRELTPETTLGYAVIEFAAAVCGITLFPWQKWLLIHALELAPGLTVSTIWERGPLEPIFRFRRIVVLVARQNGKSTLSQVLSLFFLYELGTDLILGTAQDLDTAEEVWEGALDIIEETPELAARAAKPIMVNGKKTIRLLSGERYKVKAANRKAGRGLSGDLILLDELREHQSWDAWAAITKTTNARPAAMVWCMSNAGDATSVVLRHLRKRAHEALGDPDGIVAAEQIELAPDLTGMPDDVDFDEVDPELLDEVDPELLDEWDDELEELLGGGSDMGLFEWSAPPGCPVTDIDGILQANPSTGYCIALRTLLQDAKEDPEWVFRTECLCQWSDGTLEGAFPAGTWEAGWPLVDKERPERSEPASAIAEASELTFCVDVSVDRSKAHIGVCGDREDGIPHIELIASRPNTDWVVSFPRDKDGREIATGWFAERVAKYGTMRVVVQSRGAPASSLVDDLEKIDGVEVVKWEGADLGIGTGLMFDRVALPERAGVRHNQQPLLDLAATVAVAKYLGDGAVVWDRRHSPADIAPLVAVTGALWGHIRPKPVFETPPAEIF
ncbi:terminase large subunit domain-containing protein [Agromyces sp. NPDC058064]|uniref:terminase large subunit domain-containing protein n=1 Tax=Agromyces sp. NPDC058064 TaxID=3346322 RepID=UPI0036D8D4CA